jgi:hypothetical protein
MRVPFSKTIALSLAALTLSLGLSAAPAQAHPWPHHGFHGGFGLIGAVVGLGLIGGAIAAHEEDCMRYRAMYDARGNYIGKRAVNICE